MEQQYKDIRVRFDLAASRKQGLSFSTHRGSRLEILPGKTISTVFKAEYLSEQELQVWYDSRYKVSGLKTTIPLAPTTKVEELPKVEESMAETKVEDHQENPETEAETVVEPKKETSPTDPLTDESKQEEDPHGIQYFLDTPGNEWDYQVMDNFVKEHNLVVKDRSKVERVRAINEYIEKLKEGV